MPFTPFHFGPALLVGFLLYHYLDLPTFVAANVVTDWRAALVFLGFWPPPRHSWVHTYLGSFSMALVLAAAMIYLRPNLEQGMEFFGPEQEFSTRKILLSAFTGVTLHVTLDAFHHPTMHPFYPFMEKLLYGLMSTGEVTALSFLCFIPAAVLYFYRADNSQIKNSSLIRSHD